jgi:hypothetical protein
MLVSEIKKLPRTVVYNNGFRVWEGKSDGIIKDGVLEVYSAHVKNDNGFIYGTPKKNIESDFVPIHNVFSF